MDSFSSNKNSHLKAPASPAKHKSVRARLREKVEEDRTDRQMAAYVANAPRVALVRVLTNLLTDCSEDIIFKMIWRVLLFESKQFQALLF